MDIWARFVGMGGTRSMLGKAIKEHGYLEASRAVQAMTGMSPPPADPNSYLRACLRPPEHRVPYRNEELMDWAEEHGYSMPHIGEGYESYRLRLLEEAEERSKAHREKVRATPKPPRKHDQGDLFA